VYACICHGVTEREVAGHVSAGADTVERISDSCLAGSGCGTCHERLEQLIDEHRGARPCVLAALAGDRVA
jgi:bacterioferritin-associated ferredoxin